MKEKSFKALTPGRCKLQLTLTHWPKGRCSLELKKHGEDGKIKRSHNSKNNDTLLQTFCTQTECIMLSVNENKCRYLIKVSALILGVLLLLVLLLLVKLLLVQVPVL
jgi:hypothetical protein